ncbi:MAG: YfhO family protein [Candidatus Kapaibacteriales bacterium]
MGKRVTNMKPARKTKTKEIIPPKFQDLIAIILILLLVLIFFAGAIASGGFIDFDNLSSLSFRPFLDNAKRTGNFPQWISLIFAGMPAYGSLLVTGSRSWDIIYQIVTSFSVVFGELFGSDTARVLFFYILYGTGIYWLIREKQMPKTFALFSAFAAIFSTWVITWVMIGHNTKPVVLSMIPFIFVFIERLKKLFSPLVFGFLIIAFAVMFIGNHLQMIFYGVMAFAIYLLYDLIISLIKRENWLKVLRAGILVIIAGGIAFLMSADRYLSTLEYAPYSVRGSAPIEKIHKDKTHKPEQSDYEYATMWSYSPEELFTLLVPSYFGFGIRDYREGKVSTYWGQKESEDSPPYMGILIFGLAIVGIIYFRRERFVQALILISLFAILLSFGKNFPLLYNLFYYYFPSFNQFRAPSMALVLIHFSFPILSAYGLLALKNMRDKQENNNKTLRWFVLLPLIFLIIGFIFSIGFQSSYIASVGNSQKYKQISSMYGREVAQELQNFAWKKAVEDWYINAIFLLAGGIFASLYITHKVKYPTFYFALAIITLVDLFRIDSLRMEYSKERSAQDVFVQRQDVYDFIKQDKSIFRVADFSVNPPNMSAYYLVENINGYHAAKLRVYQDLMDVANMEGMEGSTSQLYNPFLWSLLNVKYLIFNKQIQGAQPVYRGQQANAFVYLNPTYYDRAFFVKNAVVEKPLEILYHLKRGDFNPLDTVFVEKPLGIEIEQPDSTAQIRLVEKQNEYIKLECTASGNNLLFISEIYYPPSWKVYIDGQETDIIKANYAFRAVIVPKGSHIVELKFISSAFEKGKTYSIIANLLTLLIIGFGIFWSYKKEKKIKF